MRDSRLPVRARRVVSFTGAALIVAALVQELRKPSAARTWQGKVAGFVPYDFRPPTAARVRERMWAPDAAGLLVPQVFGVGWTLNVGRVVALLRRRRPPA